MESQPINEADAPVNTMAESNGTAKVPNKSVDAPRPGILIGQNVSRLVLIIFNSGVVAVLTRLLVGNRTSSSDEAGSRTAISETKSIAT